jgi:plasmid stability protein
MPVMIQIRNVPDALHAKLKQRAADAGMSLSEYLLTEAGKIAERPTLKEMLERLAALPPIDLPESPTDILRAERDSR